ncbi:MAG TPA: DUF4156 domain-containing protein [Bdellovibrionales bacterium]|nr:DUF4156 domain-containing protein [Bdellovibrionales bacterium]
MFARIALLGVFTMLFTACASRSVLPDQKEVKVSREAAPSKCREIGAVNGRASSTKGTQEQALADLRQEAANKGANYVVVKEYSAYGTSVTGVAFECP